MKIGIVTVYDGVSNIGSYLQAYAMQHALESLGHEVYFVEKVTVLRRIWQHVCRLNPKRAFLLRIKSAVNYFFAAKKFRFIQAKEIPRLDALLFGSDEIWNMDNPYFKDKLFFGTEITMPKIAYAASVGAMQKETLEENAAIADGLRSFKTILVRDERTRQMLSEIVGDGIPLVCDPTLLAGKEILQKKIRLPKEKYILVYSYGLDAPMIENIVRFAREKNLRIISAHFWHLFCDKVIPCNPLQFGFLMAGAEYVFTSTFHGALFAMMNHTQCAILPVREKVAYVAEQMGQKYRLVDASENYDSFKAILEKPFDKEGFETRLNIIRQDSLRRLEIALQCLEN